MNSTFFTDFVMITSFMSNSIYWIITRPVFCNKTNGKEED